MKRGYHADRSPCSVLYCPPEQHIDLHHPYTYDTYSAALVWLRLAVPSLAESEEPLYAWRHELEAQRDDLRAWRAAGQGEDWGWDPAAWDLLAGLLEVDPAKRLSAAEALVGPYLNADCSDPGEQLPPAAPWTWERFATETGVWRPALATADECVLGEDGD
jgi:serine/threonine protein kinase